MAVTGIRRLMFTATTILAAPLAGLEPGLTAPAPAP